MCDLFDMPGADHLNPQRIMLYLRTKEGPVLFEMAAHVAGAGPEAVIVVIGRTVESDLGLLIADERITPWTESESESKGDSGDYKEAANIDECQSEISSLTAPSFLSHGTLKSEISSLTGPTISTSSIPCARISLSSSSPANITPTETSRSSPKMPTLSTTNESASTNTLPIAECSTTSTEARDLHTAPSSFGDYKLGGA